MDSDTLAPAGMSNPKNDTSAFRTLLSKDDLILRVVSDFYSVRQAKIDQKLQEAGPQGHISRRATPSTSLEQQLKRPIRPMSEPAQMRSIFQPRSQSVFNDVPRDRTFAGEYGRRVHREDVFNREASVANVQHPGPFYTGKTTSDHEGGEPADMPRPAATDLQQPALLNSDQKYLQIMRYVDQLEVGGRPVLDASKKLLKLMMRLEEAAKLNDETVEYRFRLLRTRIDQELAELELPPLPHN